MGPIHHEGISDISTLLQINGSLTGPAADMGTRLSPWQLQKRNKTTNWASLSDWEGKRIDHWQSWHKSILDSWKPFSIVTSGSLKSPCLISVDIDMLGIVIWCGCLSRSLGLGALEDILTMGEGLRQKPVSGFAVYWLQMWWEHNWFTLWDQHDNLLALGLQWAVQVGNTAGKGMASVNQLSGKLRLLFASGQCAQLNHNHQCCFGAL